MRRAVPTRRRARWWVTAVTLTLVGVVQVAGRLDRSSHALLAAADPTRVAQSFAGEMATVSDDGALVASIAPVAVDGAGDGAVDSAVDGASTVQLLDRRTNVVTDLTPLSDMTALGDPAAPSSTSLRWPIVSGDGCTVSIVTDASLDVVRDDGAAGRFDVYQQRLPSCGGTLGSWELVSAGDDVRADRSPSVSADGTLVAYERSTDTAAVVVVVDLAVTRGEAGRQRFVADASEPALSADGSTLAYTIAGAIAVAPVRSGVPITGQQVAPRGSDPALSVDGSVLAFVSDDITLVADAVLPDCTPRCVQQVYVRDLPTGVVSLASRVPGDPVAPPVGADADALQPALGADGTTVLFVTRATNLFPLRSAEFGAPDEGDVVLAAPSLGTAVRLSTLADGITPTSATNTRASVTPLGRVAVFDQRDPATGGRRISVVDLAPQLELADLDVGTAGVGKSGQEWFVQVANNGPSAFVPHTVSIDDPNFEITGGTCVSLADRPVPAGTACSVLLRMTPLSKGVHSARLTVAEDAGRSIGGVALTVTSQVTGIGGVPAIETLPSGGDAGVVQVGTVGEGLQFDVVDVGYDPVTVTSVTVQGEQALDFLVVTDACTGVELRGVDRCSVTVAFAPGIVGDTGRRTATVLVTTDAGTSAAYLVSGTAYYAPVLTTSADPVLTGSRFVVGGSGFSPDTAVTISWADGSGATTTVFSDATGAWSTELVVRVTDRSGHRVVVAQTLDGQVASLPVQVVSNRSRATPHAPTWPSP